MSEDTGAGTGTEWGTVVHAIPDIVIRIDAHGNAIDLKSGAEISSAASRDATSPTATLAAHANAQVRAAAAQVIATQQMATVEYPLETADDAQHFEARIAPVQGAKAIALIRDITARKRAEDELFSSRRMLRSILDTIPQRVFWKDTQSVYLGCNPAVARDLGLADPADIVGQTDFDTSSREAAERFRADDRRIMSADEPKLNYEEQHQRIDGAFRWLLTSKVPIHDRHGSVIGLLGTYQDITERKNAEILQLGQNRILEMIVSGAPLHDTLTRLAQVMESLTPGLLCTVMLVHPDGRRLRSFAAPSLPAEFSRVVDGTPIAEGCGSCGTAAARKAPVITTDIRSDPLWRRHYADFADRFNVTSCWSTPILSRGGEVLGTFAMYFEQSRSPEPAEWRLIEAASDLAGVAIQSKNSEEALRKAEEKYRAIFEHALDGIFQITPEGRIVEANPALARMFGFESAAALIAGVTDVGRQLCLQPERYAEFVQVLHAKGTVQGWELPMRQRNDETLWVSLNARLASAADGQTLCYEGIAKDITERKRLEQKFLQSQKMEAFGQLAGGVAHDFNNLLTVILGNLSMIQLDDLPTAQKQTSLEDCFRAAERAANLTGQLLTFSRRNRIEPRDLDLNEVVANVMKMLKRLIGEHIAIETRPAPGGAPVRADAGLIEQAVMNLAVNSRDAMPKGGTIVLSISTVDLDAASAWSSPRARPGSFVRLTVRDTGSGIQPDHLPLIFEPFFTTKDVGKGTGLGLAMVFGIVEQHEGWIDVESQVGVGTTMHLYLPRLVSGAAPFPAPLLADVPRGGGESILVVEDEGDVRTLMCKLLERHGYRVLAASNGPEALAVWRQWRTTIDLVVTDMVMPGGLNGRELADQLVADKPALRVIYCTGYTDEVLTAESLRPHGGTVLEKPFAVHALLEQVRAALASRPS